MYTGRRDDYAGRSAAGRRRQCRGLTTDDQRHLAACGVWSRRRTLFGSDARAADVCHIGRLIVHPAAQGQGTITLLMREIERAFPDVKRLQLVTGSPGEDNPRLHQRLGYHHTYDQVLSTAVTLRFMEKRR